MPDTLNPTVLMELAGVLGLAGFVSGLGGFAFSGVASVSLWLLPPVTVVPLLLVLSTLTQLLSIGTLWREMRFVGDGNGTTGAWPFILGGLAGVPIGIVLLRHMPAMALSALLGAALCLFALVMLSMRHLPRIRPPCVWQAMVCGWSGGIMGAFSAFPSAPALAYLSLGHAPRAVVRGQLQPFILAMQLLSFGMLIWLQPAMLTKGLLTALLLCAPGAVFGTMIGVRCYRRLSDHNFRKVVLVLLLLSGASLMARWVFV